MNFYDILIAKKLSGGGGGGSSTLIDKSISANGTYNATNDNADGYKKVVVSVPNPSTGSLSITSNNTYDVTNYASAVVNVPNPSTGTLSISANGTYDVTNYASANVNVSGYNLLDIFKRTQPSGPITLDSSSSFTIPPYFFQGNNAITSFSSNNANRIEAYAFQNCKYLTSVSLTNTTKFGGNSVFEGCSRLATIDITSNYDVAQNAFRDCTSLETFVFRGKGTTNNMMYGCSSLTAMDFTYSSVYNLAQQCFYNCSSLKTLILRRSDTVIGLVNVNAFSGTPFASGGEGGKIYVPSSLISSYQSASNWSTIDGYGTITWKAIEGSIYETQYVDGTPIS